jgi:hypothetical protein
MHVWNGSNWRKAAVHRKTRIRVRGRIENYPVSVLFSVGSDARSASKSDPSPLIATHCIDELIVRPTRVTAGSRLGVKSQADSQLGVE